MLQFLARKGSVELGQFFDFQIWGALLAPPIKRRTVYVG